MDSIGTKRFDSGTGADREVQRVLMELLTQMDGFDQHTNVKVIMATNRHDTLDPALLRPGRLDRKIEFPPPDRRQKRLIFQACTLKMNLGDDVDLEDFVARPEKISAADIASICSEAGLQAVRNNRYVVLAKDFQKAYRTATKRQDVEHVSGGGRGEGGGGCGQRAPPALPTRAHTALPTPTPRAHLPHPLQLFYQM